MQRFNPLLAFLSKLAIICNGCFVFSLIAMFLRGFAFSAPFMNFVAVLGLEMAPVVSLLFAVGVLIAKLKKITLTLPAWQTILNLLMLLFQLIFIFV